MLADTDTGFKSEQLAFSKNKSNKLIFKEFFRPKVFGRND